MLSDAPQVVCRLLVRHSHSARVWSFTAADRSSPCPLENQNKFAVGSCREPRARYSPPRLSTGMNHFTPVAAKSAFSNGIIGLKRSKISDNGANLTVAVADATICDMPENPTAPAV